MKLLILFTLIVAFGLASCSKSDTSTKESSSSSTQSGQNLAYPAMPETPAPNTMPAQPAKPLPEAAAVPAKHPAGKFGDTTVTESGLMYIDTKKGTGAAPQNGQTISVNYTGKLTNGKTFDSNVDPSFHHTEPFSTKIGVGQVIPGWDEGMLTMKVGGKRRLIVPPDLGYGASGQPPTIPSNATLVFDVELLKVQ